MKIFSHVKRTSLLWQIVAAGQKRFIIFSTERHWSKSRQVFDQQRTLHQEEVERQKASLVPR